MSRRPAWGGRLAQAVTAEVLHRSYVPTLGYAPCHWCGRPASTADHWPVARVDGAPDTAAACVAACLSCNASRGASMGNARRAGAPAPSRRWAG